MKRVLEACLGMLGVLAAGTVLSGADFAGTSQNPGSTFGTATSFNLSVSMTDPGSPLRGQITLTATASDSSGPLVASVVIERSPAGAGTWTAVCTDVSAPFSCPLDTTTMGDGRYDVRARATGADGDVLASVPVTDRLVDNVGPAVTMQATPAWLRGNVTLAATVGDGAGTGVASVAYEIKPSASTTWTQACVAPAAPWSCAFSTAALTDGTSYDLRAVATDAIGNATTSAVLAGRRVDNAPPTSAMTAPASPMTGVRALGGTAGDGHSGVATATVEISPAGQNAWTTACSDATSPYSCAYDTAQLADGLYDLRLVAVDVAGNSTTSAVIAGRRADNTAPSASMSDLPDVLSGTTSVQIAATDAPGGSGVASVLVEYRRVGVTTWSTACTDTTAPYACSLTTTAVADGSYELRATAADGAGLTGASAIERFLVDNTLPAVTMGDPGTPLTGSVTVSASASDGGSGLASVRIERRPAGGAWTAVCTTTGAPFSCLLDTAMLPDGLYELRAVATDVAGNARTSAAVTGRRFDNTDPTVTVGDPGPWMGPSATLSATAADGNGSGVVAIRWDVKPTAGSTWTTACSDAAAPFQCSYATTDLEEGTLYDLRAVATDGVGRSAVSAPVVGRRVDRTAPAAVTVGDPGSPLSGVATFSGDASDALSGVASVVFQMRTGTIWTDLCSDTVAPYECPAATTAVADGLHDVRAVATDLAGNATASTSIADRMVDNVAPTVSLTDPGAYLRGPITLTATATDGAGTGVVSVRIERAPSGGSAWTEVCTMTTAPYTCPALDTATVADGLYDLRATAVDGMGRASTSTRAGRRIDNTAPTVAMPDPGSPLRGTVGLSATASDAGSGIASVAFQRSAGAGSWTTLVTDTATPFAFSWITTSVADGPYDLRALAADRAGNTSSSDHPARVVDNTKPTAADVQTASGGVTPGVIDAGDAVVFTYSEPVNPASVLAGWNGTTPQAVTVRLGEATTNDRLTVADAANAAVLPLTSATGVQLGGDYVPAATTFAGTMVQSGSAITVTLGARGAGGVQPPVLTATMTWNPSAVVTDPAGNTAATTARTETGTPADRDF